MKYLLVILLTGMLFSCSKSDELNPPDRTENETIEIPNSTVDYNSMDNWAFHPDKTTILSTYNLDIAVIDENLQLEQTIPVTNQAGTDTGIDVFFVHPTVLTQNSIPENIAIADQSDFLIAGTIIAQGGLLAKYGRMFAPRYRQSTGVTYREDTDKALQASVIANSYSDVKAAFLNYLTNYNNGNKIILAGHSQGSFLLAMLLRDVFDNNEDLSNKLLTAALGGMGYVYAADGQYQGGWWQNIPLCTAADECGCIHNWRSFDEEQAIPDINYGLPEFNPYLINSGLVYRTLDEDQDWIVQDFSYYEETPAGTHYYLAPDAGFQLGQGSNFIAFKDMYRLRYRREGAHKAVLSVAYHPLADDERPNDLADEQINPLYPYWGYHVKDYHIYLWALMEQIDAKIRKCE